jgi:hypothetical protein
VICRHGFHNWISVTSLLNGDRPVSQISPPMILRVMRNGQSTILYNSGYDTKPQMRFVAMNDDSRLNYQTHQNSYPSNELARVVTQSDYVELTLSEEVAHDYAIKERSSGVSNLRVGEETYLDSDLINPLVFGPFH